MRMGAIALREVTQDNWRATLQLAVHPEQQRFIADYAPIAAIALAKAYIRPGGLIWVPYAIYADSELVGLIELAYAPDSCDQCWIYHFFIDQAHQGKGYGTQALQVFLELVQTQYPQCRQVRLAVHPENTRAQRLYRRLGFKVTEEQLFGEPVYCRRIA